MQGWVRKFAPGVESYRGTKRGDPRTLPKEQFATYAPGQVDGSTPLEHRQGDRGTVYLLHPGITSIERTSLPAARTVEAPRPSAELLTSLRRRKLMHVSHQDLRCSVPYAGHSAKGGLVQMRVTAAPNDQIHPPGTLASTPLSSSLAERIPVISIRDLEPPSANVPFTPSLLIPRSDV